ncbi:hypothetical protein EBME_1737 [bacterium endosymbiont of Mortierella elongata FMR23-6]|nr:hypothetical protein EBME_1737 [bacterium endosymbiont of Mortierella elongata FMR23-6]
MIRVQKRPFEGGDDACVFGEQAGSSKKRGRHSFAEVSSSVKVDSGLSQAPNMKNVSSSAFETQRQARISYSQIHAARDHQKNFQEIPREISGLKQCYLSNETGLLLNFYQKLSLVQNMTTDERQEALYIAVAQKDSLITRLLLNRGVDINREDISGNRPIHIAASKDGVDVLARLFKKGVDFYALNLDGKTILQIAYESASKQTIQFMKNLYLHKKFIPQSGLDREILAKTMSPSERLSAKYIAIGQNDDQMRIKLLTRGTIN